MSSRVIKKYNISLGAPFVIEDAEKVFDSKVRYKNEYSSVDIFTKDIIEDTKKQAQITLKEAEKKALHILEEAKSEKDKSIEAIKIAKEQGYDQGYKEGYNEGYNKGCSKGYDEVKEKYEQSLTSIEQIKEQLEREYGNILANAESDIIDIILEISRKVIRKEISDKEYLFNIIKEAFDECKDEKELVLHVSSEDYNYLTENKEKLNIIFEGATNIDVKKDDTLTEGGCIIDTGNGSINASIDTKMNKIEKLFKETVSVNDVMEEL